MNDERKVFEKWAANEVAKITTEEGIAGTDLTISITGAYAFFCQMQDWKETTGQGLGFLRYYLNELLEHRILTPIKDIPDEWQLVYDTRETSTNSMNLNNTTTALYQAKRYISLLKHVKNDGSTEYTDTERCITIDIENPDQKFYMGLTRAVLDIMCPIELPYQPNKPFRAYIETAGDCTGVLYFRSPENSMIRIGRYFKGCPEQCNLEEITREQFETEKNKEGNKNG